MAEIRYEKGDGGHALLIHGIVTVRRQKISLHEKRKGEMKNHISRPSLAPMTRKDNIGNMGKRHRGGRSK